MFGWLKRMLGGDQKANPVETPERTEITRDELMGMMLNHCFSTGEGVFANIDDDGKLHIDTFKIDDGK